MYLKSIKAYGFKSFADKIEFRFGENLNGIVGPNGSGKSNVVDAVRWVLGEQSVKSLRGESSSDIIFSGSASRKALNSASVTLVFDNTDLYLPIPYTEVSVKRILYRSGENEYYLNHERCRLKDITNLLMDTGADKESFNIIGQGKIDEILSTKPEDRRVIFESASKVLKYKKRKDEALRKLDRTNDNMNRVQDILNELETQLKPLEKQSKNAQKYLELKKNLDELSIALMVHDIQFFHSKIEEFQERMAGLSDELVELENQHSSYDIDILEKKDLIQKIEEKITCQQATLLEITKSIEKIYANIQVLKERKKFLLEKDFDQTSHLLELREKELKIESQIRGFVNDQTTLSEKIQELQRQLEERRSQYQRFVDDFTKVQLEFDANNRDLVDCQYRISSLEKVVNYDSSFPNSIKNILNNQRLKGVHQVIGKLIEQDDIYTLAISVALGGAFYYLVVDNCDVAKELVKYLKENQLGRATFFPIDTIRPRVIDEISFKKLREIDGFIDVASSLVRCDDLYRDIILNQLGNVIVAKDLDSANLISKQVMKRYRVVTLDGQVIHVGGSITGGSSRSSSVNILNEKHELEDKKLEVVRFQKQKEHLNQKLEELQKKIVAYDSVFAEYDQQIFAQQNRMEQLEQMKKELEKTRESLLREIKDIEVITQNHSEHELESMLEMYYSAIENKEQIEAEITRLKEQKSGFEQSIVELEKLTKHDQQAKSIREKELKDLEIQLNTSNVQLDHLLISLSEDYNMTYENAMKQYSLDIQEEIARNRVSELKGEIREIGNVNLDAIEEYQKVSERYDYLNSQKNDLILAQNTLLEIVQEMDVVMKQRFLHTFEQIRVEFKKVFREMFHGGEAELILTDPDDLLNTGIEIQAVPSGKNLKSISLLSGGEKTFTAISLLFAILNVRPVPFCILDEVEAALDDANVESFGNYLNQYRNQTQFILITHKKKTMEFVDVLYGITMQESGVSKLVSVKLEEI